MAIASPTQKCVWVSTWMPIKRFVVGAIVHWVGSWYGDFFPNNFGRLVFARPFSHLGLTTNRLELWLVWHRNTFLVWRGCQFLPNSGWNPCQVWLWRWHSDLVRVETDPNDATLALFLVEPFGKGPPNEEDQSFPGWTRVQSQPSVWLWLKQSSVEGHIT